MTADPGDATSTRRPEPTHSAPATLEPAARDRVVLLSLAAAGLGLLWRVLGFAFNIPLRAEEAFLLNNVLHREASELLAPLANNQIAPPAVLWLFKAVAAWSTSEWALRAPSLLAGLASVLLFLPIARRAAPRGSLAPWLGLAVFSVSAVPVVMSMRAKQYALELLAGMAITALGLVYLRRPGRVRPLLVLALVCPLLFWVSYNSVFVGAAVGAVLTVHALVCRRQASRWTWPALLLLGLLAAVSFAALYAVALRPSMLQPESIGGLRRFWSEAFLPLAEPWRIPGWLLTVHAGRMYAYPVGDQNFASTPWLVLWVVGVVTLWRRGPRWGVALLLAPQAAMLLASGLKLYPYGGDPRVNIALAPAICLGIAAGVERVAAWSARLHAPLLRAAALACLLIALGGIVWHAAERFGWWRRPTTRDVVRRLERSVGPRDAVVCLQPNAPLARGSKWRQVYEWYLHTASVRPASWEGRWPAAADVAGGDIFLLQYADQSPAAAAARSEAWAAEQARAHGVRLGRVDSWQSRGEGRERSVARVDRYRVDPAAATPAQARGDP